MFMEKLSRYPFVLVRLRCNVCDRRGQYRLARLAQAFGAEIALDEMVNRLSRDCPWRLDPRRRGGGCGAFLPDLVPPRRPPDLPAEMRPLRVVKGGKG